MFEESIFLKADTDTGLQYVKNLDSIPTDNILVGRIFVDYLLEVSDGETVYGIVDEETEKQLIDEYGIW